MKKWWEESVVYQIYPRSFMDSDNDGIGDLKGITSKLDYLKTLGIDVLWISPIFKSPNVDNGYDISDYCAIMDEFGTMDDFDELLKEAHNRGLKIMLDLVVNHSSDEHVWFIESRSSKDNPKRDYYIWRKGKDDGTPPSNWGAAWGDSAWKYDENTGEYYLHLFHEKQPDLNWENPDLRNDVYNVMRYWLDKGVDGFRMDVINFISKNTTFPDGHQNEGDRFGHSSPYFMNGPRVHEFLQEMNREVLSKYDVMTVGEMPGVNTEQAKLYTGIERNELNMVFHFEHVDIGNGIFGKWSPQDWRLTELKRIFSKWQTDLGDNGWNSLYWSNHDQPRAVSRWVRASDSYRKEAAKMLAICLHMMKGTPYIYQGEELGMTNTSFEDIADYRDVETLNAYRDLVSSGRMNKEEFFKSASKRSRDNARTPMQWNDSEHAGFTKGTPWIKVNPNYPFINAKESLSDPNSIFYFYQTLIRFRKENPIVVYGTYEELYHDNEDLFVYKRSLGEQHLFIICNFKEQDIHFEIPSNRELLLTNYDEQELNHLRPFEARVYRLF